MNEDEASVVFPADGRHLGFERASEIGGVFVKGQKFDLAALRGPACATNLLYNTGDYELYCKAKIPITRETV